VDPRALLFFTHIPHTGGTAMSWHIAATARLLGGLVHGSQTMGIMIPGSTQNETRKDVLADWINGTRDVNGVAPKHKIAYGHNPPGNDHLDRYGGELQLLTFLRSPRELLVSSRAQSL
jgi:hypothetical protein